MKNVTLVDWAESYYCFENGDGTRYSVHLSTAHHGGIYVNCNETSLWRWHDETDIKFLCGKNNEYTRRAILQIMIFHQTSLTGRI